MRKHEHRIIPGLLALVPAILGIAASAMLNRTLKPEDVPSLYMQVDVVALAWISGALGSLLLAVLWMLFVRKQRREAMWRAEIARARQQAAAETATEAAGDRRRFLRRLDHELKNPLTAIHAGLANLAEVLHDDAQRAPLDNVKAQTARISHLVSDLRKLAELETRPMERAPVDVAALLTEAVSVVRERPEGYECSSTRSVTLSVPQAPWPLPHVAGDGDLIFLAIYNLLDNALKFSGADATVETRAFEDGAMVVVEVADTGPGIAEEDLPHVWQELYRGKSARGVPGSGLGLSLVRTIVERHAGQVSVRSRAGQGTVFAIRLPADENPAPPS